jgi:hypothetical protein
MSAAQQELLDRYNVTNDANGNPIVQRFNSAGGYTTFPVSGAVTVYYTNSGDPNLARTLLNSYQDFLNNINYSAADSDDAQLLSGDIAAANAALQTAYSTLAPADLIASADAVGRVRNDLPQIGQVTARPAPTYYVYDWFNWRPRPIDADAMQKPPRNTTCTNQKATMRRIAQAALSMNGMSTANKPGAGNNACAWAVNNALQIATGQTYVGGTGNSDWVPDLSKGLIAAGFTVVPAGAQNVRPGDIAVQNGGGDGGPSGDTANVYENHVGVVVQNPSDGQMAIMNNSSSNQSFTNFDESLMFSGYYSGSRDGLPRFYRVPNQGLTNQPICQG